jgi:hypothetical protein
LSINILVWGLSTILGTNFGHYGHVRAKGAGGILAHKSVFEWTDQTGGFLRSSNWNINAGISGTFLLTLQALSNASNTTAVEGPAVVSPTPAGSGQYSLNTTVAVLNFLTGAGTGVQVTIPAPVAGIFGADSVTVDPANVLVAAFVAQVIGVLTDPAGNVVTSFNTGVRSSRRVEQVGG